MIFRRFNDYCIFAILFLGLLMSSYSLSGQNLNLLFPYLNEKDQKTVEDAIEDIKKAGEMVQEANQYYNEALSLQSNYDLEQDVLQRHINTAESKAINTQLKADKIYRSTNKKVIEICKKMIEAKGSTNEEAIKFNTDANLMVSQAEEKRKSSSEVKNVYEKATLLNDASGLESAAIDNYISSIAIANNDELPKELSSDDELVESEIRTEVLISLKDTTLDSANQWTPENLAVDQGVIDKYNNYITDATAPDPLIITRSGVTGNATDDLAGLADYFQKYQRGEASSETGTAESKDTIAEGTLAEVAKDNEQSSESFISENAGTGEKTDRKHKSKSSKRGEKTDDYSVRTKQLEQEYDLSEGHDNTVRFMIQIAASRIPLTRSQLWAIYPGNLSIEVIHENNWYKYRIMGFRLYSEANRIAVESGVTSAWIVSTRDGKEISLTKARELTRNFEEEYIKNSSKSVVFKPDYYIQVAASRTPIAAEELENICNELGNCRAIIEEGWFKYQYFAGNAYNDALKISKNLTRKSFIVAYRGGTKINLYKAKRRDK
jgi:hypothetical protein